VFDLSDLVEGLSVFLHNPGGVVVWWKGALGGLLVVIVPKFVEDFGEGRPWCNIVGCLVETPSWWCI
jgi:hypothetical protein